MNESLSSPAGGANGGWVLFIRATTSASMPYGSPDTALKWVIVNSETLKHINF
jgi:hypothetical protein